MNKTKSAPRKRGAERQSERGVGEEREGKNIVRRRIIGSWDVMRASKGEKTPAADVRTRFSVYAAYTCERAAARASNWRRAVGAFIWANIKIPDDRRENKKQKRVA